MSLIPHVDRRHLSLIIYADLAPKKGITLSKCQIWRLEKAGKFPKHINVSAARIAWIESEIDEYIASRIAAARHAA